MPLFYHIKLQKSVTALFLYCYRLVTINILWIFCVFACLFFFLPLNSYLDIDIYCPLEDFHDKKIYLYVNDILTEAIELQEPTKTINVNTAPNQIITLRMETNFVQENTGGDMREMTMIISSMQGR